LFKFYYLPSFVALENTSESLPLNDVNLIKSLLI
jgi:hypothetical protein